MLCARDIYFFKKLNIFYNFLFFEQKNKNTVDKTFILVYNK